MTTLSDLRKDYARGSLDETSVDADPIRQFETWFKQALDARLPEPNTMTLATVDARGYPSARILLIKGVDERGFVFYTNYESRKGADLAVNPHASLLFYWIELERQVRVEGTVVKTGAEGVYCAALPEQGLGIALKCDDGGTRAAEVAMAAAIARFLPLSSEERANLDRFFALVEAHAGKV